MEWIKFVETLVAFSIPFAADFFNLPIFFASWKAGYKTLSSLFASGLYVYIRFSDPNAIFLPLHLWWVFILAAFILLMAYITLHISYSKQVDNGEKKSVIVIGLFIFVILYSSLTIGFSLLFQSLNFSLVKCTIVDQDTKKPVEDATVTLYFVVDLNTEDYRIGQESNSKGTIERYVSKAKLEHLKFYSVSHPDYQNILEREIDDSRLKDLTGIKLQK
jgi:hypothetical protein